MLFLGYLGIRTFRSPLAVQSAEISRQGWWSAFLATTVLTLINPLTLLSFVAVFAGLGLGNWTGSLSAKFLVARVFTGSTLWWRV